jgi:hypothetical protein
MKLRLLTETKIPKSKKGKAPLMPGRWESVQLVQFFFRRTHKNVDGTIFLYKEHPEMNCENKIVQIHWQCI